MSDYTPADLNSACHGCGDPMRYHWTDGGTRGCEMCTGCTGFQPEPEPIAEARLLPPDPEPRIGPAAEAAAAAHRFELRARITAAGAALADFRAADERHAQAPQSTAPPPWRDWSYRLAAELNQILTILERTDPR